MIVAKILKLHNSPFPALPKNDRREVPAMGVK
jgi:hypothetical protein